MSPFSYEHWYTLNYHLQLQQFRVVVTPALPALCFANVTIAYGFATAFNCRSFVFLRNALATKNPHQKKKSTKSVLFVCLCAVTEPLIQFYFSSVRVFKVFKFSKAQYSKEFLLFTILNYLFLTGR